MRALNFLFLSMAFLFLLGCSPVKTTVSNQYQLSKFSGKQYTSNRSHVSLLVTAPDAVAGYQTEQMLYIKTPFKVEAFANNAWTNPPADMLYPLMTQSLLISGYFYAVASSPYGDGSDYRLDTQLLRLHQNFLKKPSEIEFTVKLVLTRVKDSKVIASRLINEHIPCLTDTPFGGVLAANKATEQFTAAVTNFVILHVKQAKNVAKQ
jgi:cholesterol transport system auxiliary component